MAELTMTSVKPSFLTSKRRDGTHRHNEYRMHVGAKGILYRPGTGAEPINMERCETEPAYRVDVEKYGFAPKQSLWEEVRELGQAVVDPNNWRRDNRRRIVEQAMDIPVALATNYARNKLKDIAVDALVYGGIALAISGCGLFTGYKLWLKDNFNYLANTVAAYEMRLGDIPPLEPIRLDREVKVSRGPSRIVNAEEVVAAFTGATKYKGRPHRAVARVHAVTDGKGSNVESYRALLDKCERPTLRVDNRCSLGSIRSVSGIDFRTVFAGIDSSGKLVIDFYTPDCAALECTQD